MYFCDYMKLDPICRRDNHYKMTFAMSYNSAENYILPLSHDEVVHLKCSMLEKMPGYEIDKFANLRLGYTFMYGHSGKKLLFMGQEFAQSREWSEARELDWFLLENPLNRGMLDYVSELLKIYRKYPCLYEIDNEWAGFEWINADDTSRSIFSFVRKDRSGGKQLMFVLNMTPMRYEGFRIGVPAKGRYKLLLNSDDVKFGGFSDVTMPKTLKSQDGLCDYRDQYIEFDLPKYGGLIFEVQPEQSKPEQKKTETKKATEKKAVTKKAEPEKAAAKKAVTKKAETKKTTPAKGKSSKK